MKSFLFAVVAALALAACGKKVEEPVAPKVDVVTKQDAENVATPVTEADKK